MPSLTLLTRLTCLTRLTRLTLRDRRGLERRLTVDNHQRFLRTRLFLTLPTYRHGCERHRWVPGA